jgi:hypothetical protein
MLSLMLMLAMLGQCGPGGCSRRALPPPPQLVQVPPPVPLPAGWLERIPIAEPAPLELDAIPDWGWWPIVHEGRIIAVWGYHDSPHTVYWQPSLPCNAAQLAKARQR